MTNLGKLFDELPPPWPEAVVALIDALRDYIRMEEGLAEDYAITDPEGQREYDAHMQMARTLLRELETYEVNPLFQA